MPDRLLEPLATLGLAIVLNGWAPQVIPLLLAGMLIAKWKQRRRARDPMRSLPSWVDP